MQPINGNTRTALTLGTIISCAFALVLGTWHVAATLNLIHGELAQIRQELGQQWTVSDQDLWAEKLRSHNPSMQVPDPRQVRR